MAKKLWQVLLVLMMCLTMQFGVVKAEIMVADGKGEYMMTGKDSVKYGEECAFTEAVRSISQQAAVAITSSSTSVDNQLSADEIEMVTATIIKVKSKNYNKNIAPNGNIIITASVKGELDVDIAEKMIHEIVEAKRIEKDKDKLNEEYKRIKNQYSELKKDNPLIAYQINIKSFYEAIKMEREQKKDEALARYNEIIAEGADIASVYSHRGHIYRAQGQFDLAKKDYDKAASLDANEAGWHYGKAILLERGGDAKSAVREYRLFVEYADILEYDVEIPIVLKKIFDLEKWF